MCFVVLFCSVVYNSELAATGMLLTYQNVFVVVSKSFYSSIIAYVELLLICPVLDT